MACVKKWCDFSHRFSLQRAEWCDYSHHSVACIPDIFSGIVTKADAESVAKLATFSLCRKKRLGKIVASPLVECIYQRIQVLHYLR